MNGKVRHRFQAKAGLAADALIAATKAEPEVSALLQGKTIIREIAVPGRLTNFVLR